MLDGVKRIVKELIVFKKYSNIGIDDIYNVNLLNAYRHAVRILHSYPEALDHVYQADRFLRKYEQRQNRKAITKLKQKVLNEIRGVEQ